MCFARRKRENGCKMNIPRPLDVAGNVTARFLDRRFPTRDPPVLVRASKFKMQRSFSKTHFDTDSLTVSGSVP